MKKPKSKKTTGRRVQHPGNTRGVLGLLYIYLVVFFLFSFTTVLLTRGSNDLHIAERALGLNQQFWGAEGSLDQALVTLQTTTPPKLAAGACADAVATASGFYLLCGASAAAGSGSGGDDSPLDWTSSSSGAGGSGGTVQLGSGGPFGLTSGSGGSAPTAAKVCLQGDSCDTGTLEGDGQMSYYLTAKGDEGSSEVTTNLNVLAPQPPPDVIRTGPGTGGDDGDIDLDHSEVTGASSVRSGKIPADATDASVNLRSSYVEGDVYTSDPKSVWVGKGSAIDGEIISLIGAPTSYKPKEIPPGAQLLNLSGKVTETLERGKDYAADAAKVNMTKGSVITVADGKPGSAILHLFGSKKTTAVFAGAIGGSPDGDKKEGHGSVKVHLLIVNHTAGEIQVNEGSMRAGIEARGSQVLFRSNDFKGWVVGRTVTGTQSIFTRETLENGDGSLAKALKPDVQVNGWKNWSTATASGSDDCKSPPTTAGGLNPSTDNCTPTTQGPGSGNGGLKNGGNNNNKK